MHIRWHKKYSALYLRKGCEEVTREMMEHPSRYDHRLIITSDDKKTLMETANRIELVRGTTDPLFEKEYIVCQRNKHGMIPYLLFQDEEDNS